MTNLGVIPVDPTTPVGTMRNIIGDVTYNAIVGDSAHGDFTNFSDAQLQAFYDTGRQQIEYGVAYCYSTLAAQFAAEAAKVVTADLQIDLTLRAQAMRQIAQQWMDRGDAMVRYDAASYSSITYPDFLEPEDEWRPAELSQWPIDFDWLGDND